MRRPDADWLPNEIRFLQAAGKNWIPQALFPELISIIIHSGIHIFHEYFRESPVAVSSHS